MGGEANSLSHCSCIQAVYFMGRGTCVDSECQLLVPSEVYLKVRMSHASARGDA